MDIVSAQWGDAGRTILNTVLANGSGVSAPAGSRPFRKIAESGAPIAEFILVEPGVLTVTVTKLSPRR